MIPLRKVEFAYAFSATAAPHSGHTPVVLAVRNYEAEPSSADVDGVKMPH